MKCKLPLTAASMMLTIWYFHGKHWLNGVAQSARWTAYYLEAEHREHSVSCFQRCCISLPGQITHCQDMKSETAQRQLVTFLYSFFFFFNFIYLFIYLFMTVLGLRFCARAFSSCGKCGPLFIAVRGLLTIAASPVAEHRLQTRRLSNCGSRA